MRNPLSDGLLIHDGTFLSEAHAEGPRIAAFILISIRQMRPDAAARKQRGSRSHRQIVLGVTLRCKLSVVRVGFFDRLHHLPWRGGD